MSYKLWCQMCGHEQGVDEARNGEVFDMCGACGARIIRVQKVGLEVKVAEQDALIERLIGAGQMLSDYANWFSLDHPSIGDGQMALNDKSAWDALVAEARKR